MQMVAVVSLAGLYLPRAALRAVKSLVPPAPAPSLGAVLGIGQKGLTVQSHDN